MTDRMIWIYQHREALGYEIQNYSPFYGVYEDFYYHVLKLPKEEAILAAIQQSHENWCKVRDTPIHIPSDCLRQKEAPP